MAHVYRRDGDRNAGTSTRFLILLAGVCLLPLAVLATPPSWWITRGVLDTGAAANDYAMLNQGQFKNLALQAYQQIKGQK